MTIAAYQASRPSASQFLVVWHATSCKVAQNCSYDTTQFLVIEGDNYTLILSLVVLAVTVLFPFNLFVGTAVLDNNFSRTTISSRKVSLYSRFTSSSPLSWRFSSTSGICHQAFEDYKVQDGYGNLNDPTSYCTAIFAIMVLVFPNIIVSNKVVLHEYFHFSYLGKVYKVIALVDLCALDDSANELLRARDDFVFSFYRY